ncbi:hypothetical protein GCM10027595_01320 [Corynebacterium nasicanis]
MSGALVLPVFVGLLAGCVRDGAAEDLHQEAAAEDMLNAAAMREELFALAAEVGADHGGRVGIAVATGEDVIHVGLSGNSYAWSTIKVPVAVVADREGVATDDLIEAAISSSDNEAAYYLSQAIDHDLADLDHAPELAELPGETFWTLKEQAQFAAQLPCVDTAGTTYAAMADIVDWQQYGLANIKGAHFKGGWGLDGPMLYAVRQIGTVPVKGGYVGVAIMSYPDDGDHDTGVDILDALSLGIADLIDTHALGSAAICTAR